MADECKKPGPYSRGWSTALATAPTQTSVVVPPPDLLRGLKNLVAVSAIIALHGTTSSDPVYLTITGAKTGIEYGVVLVPLAMQISDGVFQSQQLNLATLVNNDDLANLYAAGGSADQEIGLIFEATNAQIDAVSVYWAEKG